MSEPLDIHCAVCSCRLPNVPGASRLCPDCQDRADPDTMREQDLIARWGVATEAEAIPVIRRALATLDERKAAMESELAALLAARGSRPGDGTDQPALFDADQPTLFGGMS